MALGALSGSSASQRLTTQIVADTGRTRLISSVGSVADLHAVDPFGDPNLLEDADAAVWWCRFADRALVLGSHQPEPESLDPGVTTNEVVRRRSGGGAVLMVPDEMLWIDLLARPGVFAEDVHNSMIQAGSVWLTALVQCATNDDRGALGDLAVYEGRLRSGGWGELVCFAGLGPGEVTSSSSESSSKLVGLSQRRTRVGVRIQGAIHRRSSTVETAALFGQRPSLDDPRPAATLPQSISTLGLVNALHESLSAFVDG